VIFLSILEQIQGHEELQNLTDAQRIQLCREIRAFLVDSISQTGGHLASNLGVVELSVAIETVYNTNIDRLVYDVGHQSYVHKLLTGRRADFATLRSFGGISGFPKPKESDSDAFVAGHASSSVSIALGMARARTLQQHNYDVITVLGDGAATGGMVYEALNDAAMSGEKMVIILNDNEMSISPNVGGFAQHLRRLRTKESYLGFKSRYRRAMSKTTPGRFVYRITHRIKDKLKRVLLPSTIFENMGLSYLGPVDGHDVQSLISLLRLTKEMDGPVLLHVHTQKGRGYAPAEENPAKFHGIGHFDAKTGATLAQSAPTFSKNFGQEMLNLARENPHLCAITAAMPEGTGLADFMAAYPQRTFDVGIAEEHAISMAGGLAKQGMTPVVAIYSTFLQRGFDQILQDIALQQLHVVLAVDRAGLVGEDGETHHGVFDVGYLGMVPGMTVLCPASLQEQSDMLRWAVNVCPGPVAIRYPRGSNRQLTNSDWGPQPEVAKTGLFATHQRGNDAVIITYGILVDNALTAARLLEKEGISCGVLRLLTVSPLPIQSLVEAIGACKTIFVVEECTRSAGIQAQLSFQLGQLMPDCRILGMDLGREFARHGDMKSLYTHYKLDGNSIAARIKEELNREK
jgi:1-deoxy-D-xylulose-5-phosphate synthase